MADSASTSAKDTSSKMECAICLEQFRRPKLLPCFHTFCQSCLDTLVQSASTFHCPSCRAITVVPSSGVGAFQTNFYIEEKKDDAKDNKKPCDICADGKTAILKCLQCQQLYCESCRRVHDSYTFGRSHTVISVQSSAIQASASSGKKSRQCFKHPDQPIILRCKVCDISICIQCKLTLHEGHATEDLADTSIKVKARLMSMLDTCRHRKRLCEAALVINANKVTALQGLGNDLEQDITQRADLLNQWVTSAHDDAVRGLRSSMKELVTSLQERADQVKNLSASLDVQCDHLECVLDADDDADIVSLEKQMSTLILDNNEFTQIKEDLENYDVSVSCKHDSTAVNPHCIRSFIGFLQTFYPKYSFKSTVRSNLGKHEFVEESWQKESAKVIQYTTNSDAKILSLCPVGDNRVWVTYELWSSQGRLITTKLLNDEGHELEKRLDQQLRTLLQNVNEDEEVLTKIEAGEKEYNALMRSKEPLALSRIIRSAAKRHGAVCYAIDVSKHELLVYGITLTLLSPLKEEIKYVMSLNYTSGLHLSEYFDLSSDLTYLAIVVKKGLALVFAKDESSTIAHCYTQYPSSKVATDSGIKVIDVCFCKIKGRELLLVLVMSGDFIHIVDYMENLGLIGYLGTEGINLVQPVCFKKDRLGQLWIGCNSGNIVRLDPSRGMKELTPATKNK